MALFQRGDFSTCDTPRPGRPKTVTSPEIIYQIHELILEDHRISAKSITEQLGISPKFEWLPGTSAGGGKPGNCHETGVSLNK